MIKKRMYINLRLVIQILLSIPLCVSAQEHNNPLELTMNLGLATYQMSQFKELNQIVAESLPFDVQFVNNYDPGFTAGGSCGIRISPKFKASVVYQYLTTGSRIGQKDYSGTYYFDQIQNGHYLAVDPEIYLADVKSVQISSSLQCGILFSKIKMNEFLSIGQVENEETEIFTALSPVIYPMFKFSKQVFGKLEVFLTLGGMIDFGGKVHLTGNKDAILMVGNNKAKTGWSGFRISIGGKI